MVIHLVFVTNSTCAVRSLPVGALIVGAKKPSPFLSLTQPIITKKSITHSYCEVVGSGMQTVPSKSAIAASKAVSCSSNSLCFVDDPLSA